MLFRSHLACCLSVEQLAEVALTVEKGHPIEDRGYGHTLLNVSESPRAETTAAHTFPPHPADALWHFRSALVAVHNMCRRMARPEA